MAWRKRYESLTKGQYKAVLPGASTVRGFVYSTDIGKLCMMSSNHGVLAVGTTQDFGAPTTEGILGIIAAVPSNTTPGSTVPFYVDPILSGEIVEADYSTTIEGSTGVSIIATSNIGYYVGWSNTTTPAGAANIDPSLAGTAAGTTNALFLKILGFSTQNDVVWGTINTSHLSL